MTANEPLIVKADQSVEPYDPERLVESLMRAGAGEHTAQRIAQKVGGELVPGTTTRQLYRRAFSLLRKEARPLAARYALRRALLEFGPSGHPFEDFVSRLMSAEGWQVETRKIIQGHCVPHEVDFYATNAAHNEYIAAELKYHNDPGYKTDLKIALYVKARFEDIFACDPKTRACPLDRGLLVTNTKFTSEAIAYAECAGVELLGWSYPLHENLFTRMSKARIYPVTALTTLASTEKRLLIGERLVSVDLLLEHRKALHKLGFAPLRAGQILAEAEELMALPGATGQGAGGGRASRRHPW